MERTSPTPIPQDSGPRHDTGETQRIADTRGNGCIRLERRRDTIRAAACDTAICTGWDLSLVGGPRRRSGAVWPVTDVVISRPDGSRLLRIPGALATYRSTRLTARRRDIWSTSARTDWRPGAPTADGCSSPWAHAVSGGIHTARRWFLVCGVQSPRRAADCRYRAAVAGWTPADGLERRRDPCRRRLGGADRCQLRVARGSPRRLQNGGRTVRTLASSPLANAPGSGCRARHRMESVSS